MDSHGDSEIVPGSNIALFGKIGDPQSFIQLRPGSWITIEERAQLGSPDKSKDLRAHAVLETIGYRRSESGLLRDSQDVYSSDSERIPLGPVLEPISKRN
jgi:hypothetical protein